MLVLILGIVVFLGIHSVRIVAPQWRLETIAAWGEGTSYYGPGGVWFNRER